MATFIKTLKRKKDQILPRTVARAVVMEDGSSVEVAIKNSSTDYVKVSAELAQALGVVEGESLSSFLVRQSNTTANTLASAEVIQ